MTNFNFASTSVYKTYSNPVATCGNADLVTTDVWTSMGYEAENEVRKKAFAAWRVNAEMMAVARPDALFMHCLPVHRGEEVDADVIDGPQSGVWDEAENRMHVQKGLDGISFARSGRMKCDTAGRRSGRRFRRSQNRCTHKRS